MTLQLVGEALSAFCSAACKHLATVGSRHSLAETMLFHAMDFLRLISSFHFTNLLCTCVATMSSQKATFINAAIKRNLQTQPINFALYSKTTLYVNKKIDFKTTVFAFS